MLGGSLEAKSGGFWLAVGLQGPVARPGGGIPHAGGWGMGRIPRRPVWGGERGREAPRRGGPGPSCLSPH